MKTNSHRCIPIIFFVCFLALLMLLDPAVSAEEEVIATLNGEAITLSEVEANVAFQVYRLQGNIYQLLKRETEEIVDRKLLAAEAAGRGLSVDELLRVEVDQTVPPLSENEVAKYLADHPTEAAAGSRGRDRIRAYLSQRARIQRKLEFMASLREKANFEFLLDPPQRPRIKINIAGQPWRGNPDAPVTLVHFTSFTCKLCVNSTKMIQKVMDEHPNKIKWVHRNYFRIKDEKALSAAQMGEAAYAQGRFWEFHDKIFAFKGDFELDDITKLIEQIGVNLKHYETAQKEGRFLLEVKEDIHVASRIGVTGLPVIFVNGWYFSGTFPYEQLKDLVQKELAHWERRHS